MSSHSDRPCLTPMVKYVGNMHGNEVHGRELLLRLVSHLLKEYTAGTVPDIKALLDGTDIHIVPTMNPDGFTRWPRSKYLISGN